MLKAVGHGAAGQAVKALAIARVYLGPDHRHGVHRGVPDRPGRFQGRGYVTRGLLHLPAACPATVASTPPSSWDSSATPARVRWPQAWRDVTILLHGIAAIPPVAGRSGGSPSSTARPSTRCGFWANQPVELGSGGGPGAPGLSASPARRAAGLRRQPQRLARVAPGGPPGPPGTPGAPGAPGAPGTPGAPGKPRPARASWRQRPALPPSPRGLRAAAGGVAGLPASVRLVRPALPEPGRSPACPARPASAPIRSPQTTGLSAARRRGWRLSSVPRDQCLRGRRGQRVRRLPERLAHLADRAPPVPTATACSVDRLCPPTQGVNGDFTSALGTWDPTVRRRRARGAWPRP